MLGDALELDGGLGFSLSFESGRGLLSTRERDIGPLRLNFLELEIPHIAFPFDVTGGAERFKTRRCELRQLAVSLSADALETLIGTAALAEWGFSQLRVSAHDGAVQFAGRFNIGEHGAHVLFRASLVVRSPTELAVVFYDTRVYGWLPVPACLLPLYLRRALGWGVANDELGGIWTLRPVEQLVRRLLPANGWKIPGTRAVQLLRAEVSREQLVVAAGLHDAPSHQQMQQREPPTPAVRAFEGMLVFSEAEAALARGELNQAYEMLLDAWEGGHGGAWARDRLLQIGAADPELAVETQQLARQLLTQDPHDTQALLALAALAWRAGRATEAANTYDEIAQKAHRAREREAHIAAELAAAAAARDVDSARALAAYERVAARDRHAKVAYEGVFALRRELSQWQAAAEAGEHLLKLAQSDAERTRVHRALGTLYRSHLDDLRRARMHFERALRATPDDSEALEGLAETFVARGEAARAGSYLARLAERAEALGDQRRLAALNVRLGEIWERALHDPDSAAMRYNRALEANPEAHMARLRLAKLAEQAGDLARARMLYEQVLAGDVAGTEAAAELVTAYTRLAKLTLESEGSAQHALACLERAVELDPSNASAWEHLTTLLRERGDWQGLVRALTQRAHAETDTARARAAHLEAAQMELEHAAAPRGACEHIDAVLAQQADDPEALDLLGAVDWRAASLDGWARARLERAAETADAPERRGWLLWQLAQLHDDGASRASVLTRALDANPQLHVAAQELVRLTREQGDTRAYAEALRRQALAANDAREAASAWAAFGQLCWQQLQAPEAAVDALERAFAGRPEDLETAWLLAEIRQKWGQPEAARTVLQTTLRLASLTAADQARLHHQIGRLAAEQEDWDGQVAALRAAVERMPDAARLRMELAAALHATGRLQELAERYDQWSARARLQQQAASTQSVDAAAEPADSPAAPTAAADSEALLWQAGRLWQQLGHSQRAQARYQAIIAGAQAGAGGARATAAQAAEALAALAQERGDHQGRVEALRAQMHFAPERRDELVAELFAAHQHAGDMAAAEDVADQWLELAPDATAPREFLAARRLTQHQFSDALKQLMHLVELGPEPFARDARRRLLLHAAAVAAEVAPEQHAVVRARFDTEFPEYPPSSLDVAWGDTLAAQQQWETLLALRRHQLEHGPGQGTAERRKQIAELLHQRLGRSDEAVRYYQDAIGQNPDDWDARTALIELYDETGQHRQLAGLLFAMSELGGDRQQALDYALRSIELFHNLGETLAAKQVLQVLVQHDAAGDAESVRKWLEHFGMHRELAQILERHVSAAPDPEDPQFTELVELVSGPLNDPGRAVAWCKRMVEAFPDSSAARRLHISLLRRYPEHGDLADAFEQWAAARGGAERADALVELSEYFDQRGQDDAALDALARAVDADPERRATVEALVRRYQDRGQWQQVVSWLQELALLTSKGPDRDAIWRQIIDIGHRYGLARDKSVASALESLTHPDAAELEALAELYEATGASEKLVALVEAHAALGERWQLRAGELAAAENAQERSRAFFERARERVSDTPDATWRIWEHAEAAWRDRGWLVPLARWRLAVARSSATGQEHARLRLRAYEELVESGMTPEEAAAEADIAELITVLDPNDRASCDAAYRAARAAGLESASARLAAVLEAELDDADPRLPDILRARIEAQIANEQYEDAARVARRMLELNIDGARDELRRALKGLYEVHGEAHLEPYVKALEDAQAWADAAAVLERAAENHPAEAAAQLLGRAASIESRARAQPERALALWQRAIKLHPTMDNLRAAVSLAHRMGRQSVVAALAPALLARLDADSSERTEILQWCVAACDALGVSEDATAFRLELVDRYIAAGEHEDAAAALDEYAAALPGHDWRERKERVLEALGRRDELAVFWVDAAAADADAWPRQELQRRLRQAAEHFAATADVGNELRALEQLVQTEPTNVELHERLSARALALGDTERYLGAVRAQLAATSETASRHALVLDAVGALRSQLEAAPAAWELLEPVFRQAPSTEMAAVFLDLAAEVGQIEAAVDAVRALAESASGTSRMQLLQAVAGVARTQLPSHPTTYAIDQSILLAAPEDVAAFDHASAYARAEGAWSDWVELVEAHAAAAASERAAALLADAADVCQRRLNDPARAYGLVQWAWALTPSDAELAERVFTAHLAHDALPKAATMVLEGALGPDPGARRVADLLQGLREEHEDALAERLGGWLQEHYPDSDTAVELRMQAARRQGDAQALYDALQARLAQAPGDADTQATLHAEIARAAHALDRHEEAIAAYLTSLATSASLELLGEAAALIWTRGSEQQQQSLLELATQRAADVERRAQAAETGEQAIWSILLGAVREAADDAEGAIAAYTRAAFDEPQTDDNAPSALRHTAVAALEALYRRRNDWVPLIDLYSELAELEPERQRAAAYHHRAAVIWRDHLVDEQQAERALATALEVDSDCDPAQLDYGLLLARKQKYSEALPHLLAQISPADADAPLEYLQIVSEALWQTGGSQQALAVNEAILRRAPDNDEVLARQGEILEADGRQRDAEAAWERYLHVIESQASDADAAGVYRHLASLALAQGEIERALARLESARELTPDSPELLQELRDLYENSGRWQEAVRLREREAALAEDVETRVDRYRALADIYLQQLDEPQKACDALEQALDSKPNSIELLQELADQYDAQGESLKFLVMGERLLTLVDEEDLDLGLLIRMGRAYEEAAGDPERAKNFYARALEYQPDEPELRERYTALCEHTGDAARLAELEATAIGALPDTDASKPQRLISLADTYARKLGQVENAAATLQQAQRLAPEDATIERRLADAYASDPRFYEQATERYQALLQKTPCSVELLRILARLSGQTQQTDRAYGYYAALLALVPDDTEAARFVHACRKARPESSTRGLTEQQLDQGVLHPAQNSPIEALFLPMAPFAELGAPGDLTRWGVSEADRLSPTDPRLSELRRILEPLWMEELAVYVWRSGGEDCRLELTTPPSVLLGAALAEADATRSRERAFWVARELELYRSGHALCGKLDAAALQEVLTGMCLAVSPDVAPLQPSEQAHRWAELMRPRMSAEVHAALVPKVQAYLQRAESVDLAAWREGCLLSAQRRALLASCDVAEAVAVACAWEGVEAAAGEARIEAICNTPALTDLLRFAVSDSYFALRAATGVALK